MFPFVRVLWSFVVCIALLTLCGCCKKVMPGSSAEIELLPDDADRRSIKAARGGALAVRMPGGAVGQVLIPGGALDADTELELVPLATAPNPDKRTVAPGFALRKAGQSGVGHVRLKAPSIVTVLIKGSVPAGAGLVRYADDGQSYTPLKTTSETNGSVTRLRAPVDGFSALGVRVLDEDEQRAADDADKQRPPYAYFIEVDGTATRTVEIWKIDYHFTMKASAPLSSDTWNGPATMTVKGKATRALSGAFARVKIDGTYKGQATFRMSPTLAPLVPPKGGKPDPALAPLVPSSEYGYAMGEGTVTMKGSGSYDAFGTAGGISLKKKDSVSSQDAVPLTVGMKIDEGDVMVVVQGVGVFKALLFALPSLTGEGDSAGN